MENKKSCLECGTTFTGRSDKLFCSDMCRTSWHNRLYRDRNNFMRRVNNHLRRNRRILASLQQIGKTYVSRFDLIDQGFRFDYFTNVKEPSDGRRYYFCYELGYMPLDNSTFKLIRREAEEFDEL